MELAEPTVDGHDAARAGLEETIGEAAGRGAASRQNAARPGRRRDPRARRRASTLRARRTAILPAYPHAASSRTRVPGFSTGTSSTRTRPVRISACAACGSRETVLDQALVERALSFSRGADGRRARCPRRRGRSRAAARGIAVLDQQRAPRGQRAGPVWPSSASSSSRAPEAPPIPACSSTVSTAPVRRASAPIRLAVRAASRSARSGPPRGCRPPRAPPPPRARDGRGCRRRRSHVVAVAQSSAWRSGAASRRIERHTRRSQRVADRRRPDTRPRLRACAGARSRPSATSRGVRQRAQVGDV